jgi:hypothetical protein
MSGGCRAAAKNVLIVGLLACWRKANVGASNAAFDLTTSRLLGVHT